MNSENEIMKLTYICLMYLNELEDIEFSNPDFRVGKE